MASILLIDDNVAFGEIAASVLRSAGHTVWPCASGKAGFGRMREHPVDLVITDIVMPDQDGLEILMELRKTHPHVKVIMMSGDNPERASFYLSVGHKLGAVRTLLKPFPLKTLLTTVAEVLHPDAATPLSAASGTGTLEGPV